VGEAQFISFHLTHKEEARNCREINLEGEGNVMTAVQGPDQKVTRTEVQRGFAE
jgi:hypothetical protein